jgi:hypothetical protein
MYANFNFSWNPVLKLGQRLGGTISVRSSTLERRPSTSGEEKIDSWTDGDKKLLLPLSSSYHFPARKRLLPFYLSMKEDSLFCFCFVLMRSTEPGCFRSCSRCLWESFGPGVVHGLGSVQLGLAVQKFLNIE